MKQRLTEIEIVPIKAKEGLVGFASLILDNEFYFGSIGIHTKLDGSGFRLTYPTKLVGIKQLNIYHPISKEASRMIEEAVITKFKEVMKKSENVGYSGFNNASE